jgi:RNA polymerase sigma factor (sigma-70 family)
LLPAAQIQYHIDGCVKNNRQSQEIVYKFFYGYAKAICERYTNNPDDAMEVVNDSFLKVFKKIHLFKPAYEDIDSSFKGWIRRIVICTAIDYFRKNYRRQLVVDLDETTYRLPSLSERIVEKMDHDKILLAIRNISPAYRLVFNLFIIDGYKHEEIAQKLDITIGTSKSNLSNARRQLQNILNKQGLLLQD